MGTLLIFVDGIGIGGADLHGNPFAAADVRRLAPLAAGPIDPQAAFRPLDATLGVDGLPQSATGQTTILTGVNAPARLGRHVQGIPGPSLRPILERESIFLKLTRAGRPATFANAYTREHLEARRPRWSATTRAVMAAGIPFRMMEDERVDAALPHDYTGDWWRSRGFDVRRRTAAEAARVLAALVERHDLVLYEYFLTDLAGHRGTWDERVTQARRVEELIDALVETIDRTRHRIVLVSDHGNLEDATRTTHTRNPVPLLVWGRAREELVERVRSLDGLAPALLDRSD